MHFSSDEFYQKLKTEITNPQCDGSIYNVLYEVIKKDVSGYIYNKIKREEDCKEVFQEIYFSVWRGLSDFVSKSEFLCEYQRKAWLNRIVKCRIADFYKQYYKYDSKKQDMGEKELEEELERQKCTPKDAIENEVISKEPNRYILEQLKKLFALNTSPEKIIAFVYTKIIIPNETISGFNGKPAATYAIVSGKSLFYLRQDMNQHLKQMFRYPIPEEIYQGLDMKLIKELDGKLVGDNLFSIDIKTITDGNNRIQKRMSNIQDSTNNEGRRKNHD